MTDTQQRVAAKAFAKNWKDRGYEKGDSQIFWVELLTTVFGVTEISQFISFEDQVHLDHTSFIDGYIEKTHVMIEQKSINKSLTAAIRQSDGSMLTPFEQAKRYSSELPYSKRPRWIVTSNFQSFYIYDMEKPGGDPEIIQLENLEKEYYRLQFLVDEGNTNLQREMEVSIAAGEIVGLLYDALAKQYVDPTTERAMKSLNILCVRMVFCLYAEDAGIFGQHGMFHDYLEEFDARKMRKAMIELFQILDTKPEDRDPYLKDDNPQLAAFPYVNGGLFANEDIEIPPFTDEIRNLLLEKASADFDWSEISPTIFGAVFESTLNPETRRSGGMHYTSIENIHKVIDPLFLDDLKNELKEIQQITVQRTKDKKLRDFQTKLSNLRWLDPASGSGNFLTETYISIRRLENEVIKELQRGQITFGFDESSPIHVSIDQFYGIEINDFAVTVAKTALWIAESQMMKETEDIVHMNLDFLPLTTNAFIVEGNSLQIDWESVVPKYQVSYIMGNPPFVGARVIDGGYYLFEKEEMEEFIKKEPEAKKYFRPWYGSKEFINRSPRYCLWLGECSPAELRKLPLCMERVREVKEYRLQSTSAGTVKLAERPTRFHVENMPKGQYIVIPEVSSQRRRYVPMGFFTPNIFCSNLVKIIPDATLYHFGVLTSNVHMAWMRVVCGRLKSDYRYSKDIVYNNFPWPEPSTQQRQKIEQTAQAILDARALYPDSSLADLYDELTMPPELRKAHHQNDMAVMQAYGFTKGSEAYKSEAACVAELMQRYQKLCEEQK